jgi:aminoglycoside phosphotransferase (APT) family kinase protein
MEQRLPGGNAGGAVLVDGTVRRPAGPWTSAVHDLLRYLDRRGLDGIPQPLGLDSEGREILTYLPGETVGTSRPWPRWVHSDQALGDVGRWLRRYHDAVADYQPRPGSIWRTSTGQWRPGDVIGHNDAAPYNAVWSVEPPDPRAARLVGFIDWDFAAPCPAVWDLAFVAFSWVPLHARDVVISEGFTDFADRPRRLRLLLSSYGYSGSTDTLLAAVQARIAAHAAGLREGAEAGDPLFGRLVDDGVIDGLDRALDELAQDRPDFDRRT